MSDDQARLQREFNNAIRDSIGLLQDQLRVQLELNATRDASVDVESEMRRISRELGDLGRRSGRTYRSATAGARGFTDANRDASFEISRVEERIARLAAAGIEGFDQLGEAASSMVPVEAREAYGQIQEMFGGLNDLTREGNVQAGQARDAFTGLYQTYARDSGQILQDDGQAIPLYMAFKDASDMMQRFNSIIRDESIDAIATLASTNENLARDMAILGEGLNLGTQETATFIKREISLYGTATGQMLEDAARYSKALEKATGISSKIIAQNIEGIMADTKTFGNVTVEEAARMSAALAQLNLDYGAVNQTVAQFQTFENAASAVGELTSVFGVHLDALELTNLANEDQEGFLRRIREQFLATGKSVETMSRAEKAFLADTLQLGDVEAVERLFASGPEAALSTMDQLATATREAGDITGEQVLASMGENLRQIDDASEITFRQLRARMQATFEGPFVEQLVTAERAYIRTTLNEFAGLQQGIGRQVELIETELTRLQQTPGWTDSDTQRYISFWVQSGAELTQAWTTNNREVSEAVTSGIIERYREEFTAGDQAMSNELRSGLSGWASEMPGETEAAFDAVRASESWGYWRGRSESPAGRDLRIGLSDGLDAFIVGARAGLDGIQARWTQMFTEIRESPEFQYWRGRSLSPAMEEVFTGHEALVAAQTQSQRNFWQTVTKLSNETLEQQLTNSASIASQGAALLGRLRVDIDNLNDEEMTRFLDRFKITEDQITQLQESAAYRQAAAWSDSETHVINMFRTWRSQYTNIDDILNDTSNMGWLQEQLGLDEEGVRAMKTELGAMLTSESGVSGAAFETALVSARRRRDAAEAEAARASAATTAGDDAAAGGTQTGAANTAAAGTGVSAAGNRLFNTAATKLDSAATALQAAATALSSGGANATNVTVNIDDLGNAIMEFIIQRDGLPNAGGRRIVTDDASNVQPSE